MACCWCKKPPSTSSVMGTSESAGACAIRRGMRRGNSAKSINALQMLPYLSNRVEPCLVTESRSEKDTAQSDRRLRAILNRARQVGFMLAGLAVLKTHPTNLNQFTKVRGNTVSEN